MSDELNPDIKKTKIGKVKLYEIELLPLSFYDQTELSELIKTVLNKIVLLFDEDKGLTSVDVISLIIDSFTENLDQALALITGKTRRDAKAMLKDITNNQLKHILETVWEQNYKDVSKNVISLFETLGATTARSASERSPQPSLSDTPNTTSHTSTEEAGETEDLQSDKSEDSTKTPQEEKLTDSSSQPSSTDLKSEMKQEDQGQELTQEDNLKEEA